MSEPLRFKCGCTGDMKVLCPEGERRLHARGNGDVVEEYYKALRAYHDHIDEVILAERAREDEWREALYGPEGKPEDSLVFTELSDAEGA